MILLRLLTFMSYLQKELASCCRYGTQALLWRHSPRRWKISYKDVKIDWKDNGKCEKGTLLDILQTSPYLWFRFWGWSFARNLGLLWQQLGAWHVHWKTSAARILFREQGKKWLLVEAMEWIWSFEGSQEVPKTWFLIHLVQQMVAQRQHFGAR